MAPNHAVPTEILSIGREKIVSAKNAAYYRKHLCTLRLFLESNFRASYGERPAASGGI